MITFLKSVVQAWWPTPHSCLEFLRCLFYVSIFNENIFLLPPICAKFYLKKNSTFDNCANFGPTCPENKYFFLNYFWFYSENASFQMDKLDRHLYCRLDPREKYFQNSRWYSRLPVPATRWEHSRMGGQLSLKK